MKLIGITNRRSALSRPPGYRLITLFLVLGMFTIGTAKAATVNWTWTGTDDWTAQGTFITTVETGVVGAADVTSFDYSLLHDGDVEATFDMVALESSEFSGTATSGPWAFTFDLDTAEFDVAEQFDFDAGLLGSDGFWYDLWNESHLDYETSTANGQDTHNVASLEGAFVADVTAVPVPAAAWLLGSGLVGLAGWQRRRRLVDQA